jgi:hypothetical protein
MGVNKFVFDVTSSGLGEDRPSNVAIDEGKPCVKQICRSGGMNNAVNVTMTVKDLKEICSREFIRYN